MKMLFIIMAISSVILLFCVTVLTVHAQSDLQTTKYRNTTVDLVMFLMTTVSYAIGISAI
jgi:hypothetical protein